MPWCLSIVPFTIPSMKYHDQMIVAGAKGLVAIAQIHHSINADIASRCFRRHVSLRLMVSIIQVTMVVADHVSSAATGALRQLIHSRTL